MSIKDEIRAQKLAQRLELNEERRHELSQAIQEKLIKSPLWPQAGSVALYAAVKGEVMTHRLFQKALERGLHVYFPRVEQGIKFYEVSSPDDLQRGSWSILEPKMSCPELASDETLNLLVVPGIAFSKNGYRVGYGRSFYDRYLDSQGAPPTSVGLAYDFQMIDSFPLDHWDRALSAVVTEKVIYSSEQVGKS